MRNFVLVVLVCTFSLAAAAQQRCAAGDTNRLVLINQCGDDVWMVETPPGSKHPVQAQWDWFKELATATQALPNGGAVSGVLLKSGTTTNICVPDKGAPGGNLRFYMGCPNNNASPFDRAGCTIGSAIGDLAGVNTLVEPTFGCKPGMEGAQCAFNPSSPADKFPHCADNPGPDTCAPMPSGDNFDISAVDGFTIPVRVDAKPLAGQQCNRLSTDAGMLDLASCPTENNATLHSDDGNQQSVINSGLGLLSTGDNSRILKACSAPYKWFFTSSLGMPPNPSPSSGGCQVENGKLSSGCFYAGAGCDPTDRVHSCPAGSGPQQKVGPEGNGQFAIQNTHWVQDLYALGYNGYTWQYGDGVGDQACGWGGTITVTLCPRGGVPYRAGQLWRYSQALGNCTTDGSTGVPDGVSTFKSLATCQRKNMKYTCDDLTANDPFGIPAALWKADPDATKGGTGFTYDRVQESRKLVCSNHTVNLPGQGTFTLPECNYYYADAQVCPTAGGGAPPVSSVSIGASTGVRNATSLPVSLTITNTGIADEVITLQNISLRTLAGSGEATLRSPELPIVAGSLRKGANTVVTLQLSVPVGVGKLAIGEIGTAEDPTGSVHNFGSGQVIFP